MDNLNIEFGEVFNIVPAIMPIALDGQANPGDYVSFRNYQRATVVVLTSIGTAGDDITITVNQATDVAGTGSKVAAVLKRGYLKQGATDLDAVGAYTLVEQTVASTYTSADNAENEFQFVFDILPEMLDLDGGFDCFNISIADVGTNAQIGCAFYIMRGARGGSGVGLPSAIVD
jgi:hypothetical protein